MATIKVLATPHPDFPGSYTLNLRADGRLLGIGKDAVKAACERLEDEGMINAGDEVLVTFTDNRPAESVKVNQPASGAITYPDGKPKVGDVVDVKVVAGAVEPAKLVGPKAKSTKAK